MIEFMEQRMSMHATCLWYMLPKYTFYRETHDHWTLYIGILESQSLDPDNSVNLRKINLCYCDSNAVTTTYLFITNAISFIQSNAFVAGAIARWRNSAQNEQIVKLIISIELRRMNWIEPNRVENIFLLRWYGMAQGMVMAVDYDKTERVPVRIVSKDNGIVWSSFFLQRNQRNKTFNFEFSLSSFNNAVHVPFDMSHLHNVPRATFNRW